MKVIRAVVGKLAGLGGVGTTIQVIMAVIQLVDVFSKTSIGKAIAARIADGRKSPE